MSDEKMEADSPLEEDKIAAAETGAADAADTADANAAADGAAGPEEQVRALENELATARQDVLYAHAETQNLRRRMEKELADARSYSTTAFARDILSVADNLGRALASIPQEQRDDERLKNLVVGIEATERELVNAFGRHGIEKIEAMGQMLDPNLHQAMLEVPSDAAPGTIIQEMQSGYRIKDRLLRPALVGVAKKPD
ncbi:MAG: nucleotide exchange factor GrpE [Sphingobium sp.]